MAPRKRKFSITTGRNNGKAGIAKGAKSAVKAVQKARKASPQRQALLEQVRRQQRSTSAKIGRLSRKGINVKFTDFDPRRKDISKMSMTQLRAHSRRLAVFNDRSTQFVMGNDGAALPVSKFIKYKEIEAQINMRAVERAHERADIELPGQGGATIGQRKNMLAKEDIPRMDGGNTHMPFNPTNRRAEDIKSVEALDKFIANGEKVLRRGHLRKEIKSAREALYKMIDSFGDAELMKKARKLTNNQLDILWFDYKYVKEILNPYTEAKMLAAHGRGGEVLDALEDDIHDIHEALDWASELPRTAERKS